LEWRVFSPSTTLIVKSATSVLELIGNTPLLELNQLRRRFAFDGRLLAKLENLNPGGSKKDRVALAMVQTAKADGRLASGQAVVEITSGNTGCGLAVVCRALGHPFYAVMSSGNTRERAQMIRAFGANLILVPQAAGGIPGRVSGADMAAVRQRAASVTAEMGAFFCDQFENPANSQAHEDGTAPELWRQCGGQLNAIVVFVGSGGALAGMSRYLRKQNPKMRAYAVEPAGATSLASHCCSDVGHRIQGGGYGKDHLTLLEGIHIDDYLRCTDDDAADKARILALDEGVMAGYSTGAQLHCALELLRERERGSTISFLVCDTGLKYLSTGLYP
jgi:cysteine synthase A